MTHKCSDQEGPSGSRAACWRGSSSARVGVSSPSGLLINTSTLPEVPPNNGAPHCPTLHAEHVAPSSPVENQIVAFESFIGGSAPFGLDSPRTIATPEHRGHNRSHSILSRKAYLGGGKRPSLLVGPSTCGLAVLITQSTLPSKFTFYLHPTHSHYHHSPGWAWLDRVT